MSGRSLLDLGVECTLDPTVTPMMDGDRGRSVWESARLSYNKFSEIPRSWATSTNSARFQRNRVRANLDATPCSAGHTACYVSPYGDVFPCVQFPFSTANVRRQRFVDIWRNSEQMNEVRSIRVKDLTTCTSCSHVSNCTRCPGLAFMEGNMRGPSSQDCEKSFARTGIPSANMLAKKARSANLVQIRAVPASTPSANSAIA